MRVHCVLMHVVGSQQLHRPHLLVVVMFKHLQTCEYHVMVM